MKKALSILSFVCCLATLGISQSQLATIKIEKTENGVSTIVEKQVELTDGQSINSILQELGVLDELGNLKEGQSFEINVKKIDGPNINQDITIEYFDAPDFEFDFEFETKAFLGVMLSDNYNEEGVLVSDIIEGTQAEKAGIQPGDIIQELNGVRFNSVSELVNEIGALQVGESINLILLRSGESIVLDVILGEKTISPFERKTFQFDELHENFEFPEMDIHEDGIKIYEFHMDDENGWDGNYLEEFIEEEGEQAGFLGVSPEHPCSENATEKGVLLGRITPNSTAEKMGLQAGDVITKMNKEEVNNFDELANVMDKLKKGDEIKLTVLRDNKKSKMSGILGSKPRQNCFKGADMFHDFHGNEFPEYDKQREFYFKFDGSDDEMQLEGLEDQLEDMMRSLENMEGMFDAEEFERELEEMLTPMLEEYEIITEEININISIELITDEDLTAVNQNAQVPLSNKDDLGFDFVNFFPNPNNGEFNLRFHLQDDSPYSVFVYNQSGQTVFEDSRSLAGEYMNTIDLNSLANGPYFLMITQGNKSYSRKIIKE